MRQMNRDCRVYLTAMTRWQGLPDGMEDPSFLLRTSFLQGSVNPARRIEVVSELKNFYGRNGPQQG